MRAMVLERVGEPLALRHVPAPLPAPGQVAIAIAACGVCRTDLHVVDGELPSPKLPLIPGHEIVGRITALGSDVGGLAVGQRVGVPWLGHACGSCSYCRDGRENLCDAPGFTGYTLDGGYAEACVADAAFVVPLPDGPGDAELAPWLCAGLIGFRSLMMAGEAQRIGLYGFGAAAHLVAQIARFEGRDVLAFTRPGDKAAQAFALRLGCVWAGGSDEPPPVPLDAAILFAPVGALVPLALAAVRKGGIVVCGGIHMSDVPSFPYRLLWEERILRSVANLTRADARGFVAVAARAALEADVETFALEDANLALDRLRRGQIEGAAVLVPGQSP